jgi:hypothetical protein
MVPIKMMVVANRTSFLIMVLPLPVLNLSKERIVKDSVMFSQW